MSNLKINMDSLEDVEKSLKSRTLRVCVVGIGRIGLPTALSFAKSGLQTIGVDINENLVENINSGIFPLINSNSEIEYFITATNISGNSVSHPNSGWHIFSSADSILGDVNSDNVINILDIILVVNIILGINDFNNLADINNDGSIDILDVVQLVNIILN